MASSSRRIMIIDAIANKIADCSEVHKVIVSLPHPKSGKSCKYLFMNGTLLEIQKATPTCPASWFVGDSVIADADGAVLIATPMDPLFILLPILSANDKYFSPLSQYLTQGMFVTPVKTPGTSPADVHGTTFAGASELTTLHGLETAMGQACDVKVVGEDTYYRLNREKVLSHLAARVRKLAKVLHGKAIDTRAAIKSQFGAFTTSSKAVAAPMVAEASSELNMTDMRTAVGILGEYLHDEWTIALTKSLGLDEIAPTVVTTNASGTAAEETKSSETPSKDAMWNAAALDDDNDNLVQKFVATKEKTSPDSDKKKPQTPILTVAQRKLANTNRKGMKSLSSFFGMGAK